MPFELQPQDCLRILCGVWFLPHLIGKVRNFEKAPVTFEKAGLKPGKAFLVLTIVLEVLAALGMIFNVYSKAATGCAIVVLLGAAYAVVKINGAKWRWQQMGPEFPLFWALACLISAL
ncbi:MULTISPECIES: DoxX family membrane protein [unclassified Mesorhizobium]|uniref:DoxX family protein n=1 Tax=unclassified Mesorhizobium TaxID=325217 RepID=UPI002414E7FC|nr:MULTISPECIES: DoxX family membrane protein [unclassified Mesorhizobium]MDG4854490.1 DoxX family membrane protein [Mesorhizobium sp. WSM4982]MDG4915987.1 DoxX family membrane protein [Mesorhizobium sp. WSM4983]